MSRSHKSTLLDSARSPNSPTVSVTALPSMVDSHDDLNLLLSNIDCAILLLAPDLTLVRYNDALVKAWGLLALWLDQHPVLAEILQEIQAQGYWSAQQCETFYQTIANLEADATIRQVIEQANHHVLDVKATATPGGRRLILLRESQTCRPSMVERSEQDSPLLMEVECEQNQQMARFRESERYIRQLTENVQDIFWISDPSEPRFLYVSHAFEEVWGHPAEALYQNFGIWCDAIHPEDRDRLSVNQCLDQAIIREYRILRADGSMRWIRDRVFPIKSRTGEVCRLTGIAEDITDQKQREERLHLLESVVVNANDSIIVTQSYQPPGPGPFIVYVNPAFIRMTGYQPEEVIGKTPRLLQGPKTDRTVLARIRQSLQMWEPIMVELINYRKDRSEFWVELSIVPVMDHQGQCMHWIAIQRDITQRKQLEAELLKTLEKEQQLGELKSRFVTNTSHEFRTPLSIILSAAELLEHYGHEWSRAEQVEQLQLIQSTVQHMTDLLEDILLIGKTEGDDVIVTTSEIALESFCQGLLADLQKGIGKHHILRLQMASDEQGKVWLDEKLLRQTLNNLLSNAIKYSPSESVILLKVAGDDQHIIFQVADQGIGIPTREHGQMFEFFKRATNVGIVPGSGLGLAIAKHCVEAQHGTMSFVSTEGKGSTFTVTLPRSLMSDLDHP